MVLSPSDRNRLMLQRSFVLFGISGALGFIVDSAAFYLFFSFIDNPYICRAFSYICAATFTWLFNRSYTFRSAKPQVNKTGIFGEWVKYLSSQLSGFAVNYSVFSILINSSDLIRTFPILAIAAGSICGLIVNYSAAKFFVFRVKQ
jgi:putative flippase GtrA